MAKIKIIEVPTGPVPRQIRERWLGLEMVLQHEDPKLYYVSLENATAALTENGHSPIAGWWKTWGKVVGYVRNDCVSFKKECCSYIP